MNIKSSTDNLKRIFFSIAFLTLSFISFAQDSTVTATTTTNSSSSSTETAWYMQPVAWVIGGVVLLILLIALFRNNSTASDSVTVTKTVSRDTDV